MNSKRIFGLFLIIAVSMWDLDATRAHIAAHSWYTLCAVLTFFVGHAIDYLTIGRVINRTNFDWAQA